MSKDHVSATDGISVGLERTPPKAKLELVQEPRCPKCGSLSRDRGDGQRECADAACGCIFDATN
jgi:hypothetical protein